MKLFITTLTLCLTLSTSILADSRIVGKTEQGCPVDGKIIHLQSKLLEKILILEETKVHELSFYKKTASISFFRSPISTPTPPTFEVRLMGTSMSRLSEVTIYYSGIKVDCLIDLQ